MHGSPCLCSRTSTSRSQQMSSELVHRKWKHGNLRYVSTAFKTVFFCSSGVFFNYSITLSCTNISFCFIVLCIIAVALDSGPSMLFAYPSVHRSH
jgi:hypothetical protein